MAGAVVIIIAAIAAEPTSLRKPVIIMSLRENADDEGLDDPGFRSDEPGRYCALIFSPVHFAIKAYMSALSAISLSVGLPDP